MGVQEPASQTVATIKESLAFEGLSCSVWINDENGNKPQLVYGKAHNERNDTGYIISQSGAQFTVVVEDRLNKHGTLAARLFLDGEEMESSLLSNPAATISSKVKVEFRGKRTSPTAVSPYLFSKISLSDKISECNQNIEILNHLGSISVKICRVSLRPQAANALVQHIIPTQSKIINERTKKATMSHSTSLGAPAFSPAPTFMQVDWIDGHSTPPFFCFTFLYRSRELLELQSIIEEEAVGPGVPDKKKRVVVVSDDDDDVVVKKEIVRDAKKKKQSQVVVLSDSE